MFKKMYFSLVLAVSMICCIIFFTIIVSARLQHPIILTNRQHIVFRVDDSFSATELKSIRSAMLMWKRASGNRITLSFYTDKISVSELCYWAVDGRSTIYNARSLFSWRYHLSQYMTMPAYKVLGATIPVTGDIFIIDDTPEPFKTVVAHEIGHVFLGDYHSNDINSLMYPILGKNYLKKTITKEDAKLLEKVIKE